MEKPSLQSLLSIRTAPFREQNIRSWATTQLDRFGVPHCVDPVGNLIVGAASLSQYAEMLKGGPGAQRQIPQLLFVAHMDHPGFHGLKWSKKHSGLEAEFHGGGPIKFLEGAPVEFESSATGNKISGKIRKVRLNKKKSGLEWAEIQLSLSRPEFRHLSQAEQAHSFYGSFKFSAPVWKKGPLFYTQAADDLGGCFAVVRTAIAMKETKGKSSRFLGLLTRGEEVGFIGALAHFKLPLFRSIKTPPTIVSLETSRTLSPGAIIGAGPVVRLGDRSGPFDTKSSQVLTQIAQTALPQKHQRRVMEGGSCEASAAIAYGFPAIGISVPLGNYHNQSIEGGPESAAPGGPAPEFIHQSDVEGLLLLCQALCRSTRPSDPLSRFWKDPWASKRKVLDQLLRDYQKHLT